MTSFRAVQGVSRDECANWSGNSMLALVKGKGRWYQRRLQRRVVLHLLTGCPACSEKMRGQVGRSRDRSVAPAGPAPALGRYQRALARLEQMERPARELFLNGVEGLRSPAFVEWLVLECRKSTSRDPERAMKLARLAVLASGGQDANTRALAAMRMGQVLRRCRGDFLGAETWFDKASEMLRDGGMDELLVAKLLRLKAVSRYGQRRSEEAIPLFDEAISIYQAAGHVDLLGKAFIEKAGAMADVDGPKAAIGLAFRACGLIDFEESPRQAAVVAQNLSLYFADLGEVDRALAFLDIARELLSELGNAPADALRMEWSSGRILAEVERYEESATVFRSAKAGFVELGLAAEAGQVSLDLALSLVRTGRMSELREVAEDMLPIFQSRLLHKEALAAVGFFRQAVLAETITAAQIHAVADFLVNLESDSHARFRKPD